MAAEFNGFSDFLNLIREDWIASERSITRPGFHAVIVHRFGSWAMGLPLFPKILLVPIYAVLYWFIRNFYGIELPHRTKVGRRFVIGHQSGIVIHPFAVIGDDCIIRQNVTIGAATKAEAPLIGDRVEFGAGAVVMGRVIIGDDVRIGPNAVVMTNVPAGATVVVQPPRIFQSPQRNSPAKDAPACATKA